MKKILSQVTYAELVLAAILVLGSLGIWTLISQLVARSMLMQAPRLESFEATSGIPMQQAKQAGTQAQMESLQKELSVKEMLLMEQASEIATLETSFPQLSVKKADLAELTAFPTETVDDYISTLVQIESSRSIVAIMENEWQELVEQKTRLVAKTTPADTPDPSNSQLNLLDAQLTVVQAELVKQKLEVLHQEAKEAALRSLSPELAVLAANKSGSSVRFPVTVVKEYLTLLREQQETNTVISSYQARLAEIEKALSDDNQSLEVARQKALQEFERAQNALQDRQRWIILGWSTFAVVILFLLALGPVSLYTRAASSTNGVQVVYWFAGAFTAILLAYQAFDIIGAILLCLLLLFIFLLLDRRSTQAATPVTNSGTAVPPEGTVQ